ncbi:MAG: 7-carboxy-7-deazaguanine synthase, partial [Candidatus Omnitrophica bacterium]|nr:7-carboxy-7-deazaguanine synthase [Candidatus Omnitrophota bacterium]
NRWANIACLKRTDEVKFVLGTDEDYRWAKQTLAQYQLCAICPVLFSHAFPLSPDQKQTPLKSAPAGQTPISRQQLAERIVADALEVRFQLQMHKFIWPATARGV